MGQTPCVFVGGGPWDGETKLINDEWADVRIATSAMPPRRPRKGTALIAIPSYVVYLRSDISPFKFEFATPEDEESDASY